MVVNELELTEGKSKQNVGYHDSHKVIKVRQQLEKGHYPLQALLDQVLEDILFDLTN